MTNIVQRLRAEAKGNLLTSQKGERAMLDAADEIERLRAALKPFADAVFNDNGDITITPPGRDAYIKAYNFIIRGASQ